MLKSGDEKYSHEGMVLAKGAWLGKGPAIRVFLSFLYYFSLNSYNFRVFRWINLFEFIGIFKKKTQFLTIFTLLGAIYDLFTLKVLGEVAVFKR